LADIDWRVRGSAAKAIAKISPHDYTLLNQLMELLTDKNSAVRFEVFSSIIDMIECQQDLTKIDTKPVIDALTDERADVREYGVRILTRFQLERPAEIDAIIKALCDPVEAVRFWSLSAIGSLGMHAPSVIPSVIQMLMYDTDDIKLEALSALGRMGPDACTAIPALNHLLEVSKPDLQFHIACTLTRLNAIPYSSTVIRALRQGLHSRNADERRLAKLTLERLHAP
jgi:HEAT repeat protein